MGGKESKLLRNFDVEEVLGAGGFGMVLKGKNKFEEQPYAIKLIALTSKESLSTSKKEMKLLAAVPSHQCVVGYRSSWVDTLERSAIQDLIKSLSIKDDLVKSFLQGTKANFLCIQMELCWIDLATYLHARAITDQNIRERVMWRYFGQILKGLAHIHRYKIIHRDLKPENIFICDMSLEEVKIGDLGLATFVEHRRSQDAMSPCGTIFYMAPEQVTGKYDVSVDIYALGLILSELFSKEKDRFVFVQGIRNGNIPEEINKSWPEINSLIISMTKTFPKERIGMEDIKNIYKQVKAFFAKDTHDFVTCDGCSTHPIRGLRYNCKMCENYDICENCKNNGQVIHNEDHEFDEMTEAKSDLQALTHFLDFVVKGRTSSSTECCSKCNKALENGQDIFKCTVCSNCNYCSTCHEESEAHTELHKFEKVTFQPKGDPERNFVLFQLLQELEKRMD